MQPTREQLLDAAERLFAARGVDAVSLREITAAADANVAAVNYHFGSKDNLVREVFARRLQPINAERQSLLDLYESRARSGHASLEQVMFAFVYPVFRRMVAEPEMGAHFVKLMGHVHTDTNGKFARTVLEQMRDTVDRFVGATVKAMPGLDLGEVFWRSHFSIGVMVHTATAAGLLAAVSDGRCRIDSAEEVAYRVVAFIVAGFKADPSRIEAAIRRATPEEVLA
jgi:AcrR family transcriptional regulator